MFGIMSHLFEVVIVNALHLRFLVVHGELHKSLIKRLLTYVQYSFDRLLMWCQQSKVVHLGFFFKWSMG